MNDVVIRLVVDGEEQIVPAFERGEAAARGFGRAANRNLRPAAEQAGRVQREANQASVALGRMSNASSGVGRLNTALGTTGRILAGVAVTAGLIELSQQARQASAEIAAIGDAADRLEVSTAFLQQLEDAQRQLGQPVQGLEESLAALQRRIGEARGGNAEAARLFDQLEISLTGAAGAARPFEEVFVDVLDALRRVEDPQQRAAAGQRLLEEGYRRLIPLIGQGANGFERLGQNAQDAGRIIQDDLVRASQNASVILSNLDRDVLQPLLTNLATGFNTALLILERFTTARNLQSEQNLIIQAGEQRSALDEIDAQLSVAREEVLRLSAEGANSRIIDARLGLVRRLEASRNETLGELGEIQSIINGRRPTDVPAGPDAPAPLTLDFSSGGGSSNSRERESRTAERLAERIARTAEQRQLDIALIGRGEVATVRMTAAFEREVRTRELRNAAAEEGSTITATELRQAEANLQLIEQLTVRQAVQRQLVEDAARAEEERLARIEELNDEYAQLGGELANIVAQSNNWRDALSGVLSIVQRLVEQGLQGQGILSGVLGGVIPGLTNGVGNLLGNSFAFGGASVPTSIGFGAADLPVFQFRNGAAFDRGRVVDTPTSFGMTLGRRGIMAEEFPEAIMPLRQMSDGRLGVEAANAGGPPGGDTFVFNVERMGEREASRLPSLVREARSNRAGGLARTAELGQRRAL
ncbi:MAG: hypothetical protein AAFR84_02355 [Pseudomonadota bacterium]